MGHITAWIHWNPPREAFTLPFLNLPIMWYGIVFALGFVFGYLILVPLYRKTLLESSDYKGSIEQAKNLSSSFAEKITWFIVLGTVIGARLGHVLFYDFPYYADHPLEIVMIRKGGLASHGGTIGVIISLNLFNWFQKGKFPGMSTLFLMDILVIPTAVVACFIRIANFFNQEILGFETLLPWGIIFGNPVDGSNLVPRHPVQLYEAIAYLATFFILYFLWKAKGIRLESNTDGSKLKPGLKKGLKQGTLSGLFFVLVFGSRFFLEFFKTEQISWLDHTSLQMGQLLSLPFVLLGCILFFAKDHKDYRRQLHKQQ